MIKFPKEEILIINEVTQLYDANSYSNIAKMYDKILEKIDVIMTINQDTITYLVDSLFFSKTFDKIIPLIEHLRNKGYENYDWYFYGFASLIATDDLLYTRTLIKKSKLFSDPSIQFYFCEDGANYGNILGMDALDFYTFGPCCLLINFLNELINESFIVNVDKDYIFMRFFDFVNILMEDGADVDVIDLFGNVIKIIYDDSDCI